MSCRGNPVRTWGDLGDRMESTGEREAEVGGYRPGVKGGCCWWICSDRLSCSDPRREGSWDEPVVQVS